MLLKLKAIKNRKIIKKRFHQKKKRRKDSTINPIHLILCKSPIFSINQAIDVVDIK
jgi:hypothetical protein